MEKLHIFSNEQRDARCMRRIHERIAEYQDKVADLDARLVALPPAFVHTRARLQEQRDRCLHTIDVLERRANGDVSLPREPKKTQRNSTTVDDNGGLLSWLRKPSV